MKQARKFLTSANKANFSQNEKAKIALQSTGTRKLGESSSNKTLGTGVNLFSKKATDQSSWTGENLMDSIVEEIREKLFFNDEE